MFECTLCGLEVESLSDFAIVRTDNKSTVVLGPDGIAHTFRKVRGFSKINSEIATRVNHERWHVARGIIKPGCPLCTETIPQQNELGDFPQV